MSTSEESTSAELSSKEILSQLKDIQQQEQRLKEIEQENEALSVKALKLKDEIKNKVRNTFRKI